MVKIIVDMKDHENKGIVRRQIRVYVHILTHCMGKIRDDEHITFSPIEQGSTLD